MMPRLYSRFLADTHGLCEPPGKRERCLLFSARRVSRSIVFLMLIWTLGHSRYFQSRPEISAALSGHAGNSNSKSLGPTIGQRLFSSAAAAAASGGSPKPRMGGIGGGGFSSGGGRVVCRLSSSDLLSLKLTRAQSDATSQEQQEESLAPVAGRVAAAAAAFSQHRLSTPSGPSSSGPGGMTNVRCVSSFVPLNVERVFFKEVERS